MYRLLYSLQVLDGLTEPIEDKGDVAEVRRQQQTRDEWTDRFLEQGGFTHLFHLLTASRCLNPKTLRSAPPSPSHAASGSASPVSLPALRQRCLGLVLRLLHHLLLSAMRVQRPELGGVQRGGR